MSSHDIARRFETSQWQGISRHLRVLTEAGLLHCEVREERAGLHPEQGSAPGRRRPVGDAGRHRGHAGQRGKARLRRSTSDQRNAGRQPKLRAARLRGLGPCLVLQRPPQERLHLVDVHRAPHGRQRRQQHAAVGRRRQPRVEHGNDTAVLRVADEPARPLRQQRGRPRQVDQREGAVRRPGPGAPAAAGRRDAGKGACRSSPATAHGRGCPRPARSPWWRTGRRSRPTANFSSRQVLREIALQEDACRAARAASAAAAASVARLLVNRARVRPPAASSSCASSSCSASSAPAARRSGRWRAT